MGPALHSSVYSGVPVYEIVVRNTAVMRRQSDSFLNATQILKVAGVDKARRTKILEKEILAGRHEKVQGGYGKYQGTWIPYDRAAQLCSSFGVQDLLEPLLSFPPGSHPTVPVVTSRAAVPKPTPKPRAPSTTRPRKPKYTQDDDDEDDDDESFDDQIGDEEEEEPAEMMNEPFNGDDQTGFPANVSSAPSDPAPTRSPSRLSRVPPSPTAASVRADSPAERQHRFRERIVRAFVEAGAEPTRVPGWLERGEIEQGVDVQGPVDEEGRTALHWSASLSRPQLLRALLRLLPRHSRDNNPLPDATGMTPLMLASTTTNCYDRGTFGEILDLLQATLAARDNRGRTLLHHIAEGWDEPRLRPALLYYLGCVHGHFAGLTGLMERDGGEQARTWLGLANAQDGNGDTAANVAARMGGWKLVGMLERWGADLLLRNKGGIGVQEWKDGSDEGVEKVRILLRWKRKQCACLNASFRRLSNALRRSLIFLDLPLQSIKLGLARFCWRDAHWTHREALM
ncbi:apses-domain-containing protein [Gonapodya prolifera JEL478]|uniref:Apses-domain-containing protein n=1 Tax=Gonapodya prolifera (strain JEL478) TaxID=1344416 RepID=A0A139AGV9_GONPJ|nr:apses-domain-containing protein [Gonapodya prolifera JEL478]|eukprot:KXS15990.1 apses-domain-containing protein [Gonapodya prolifera JEL478]